MFVYREIERHRSVTYSCIVVVFSLLIRKFTCFYEQNIEIHYLPDVDGESSRIANLESLPGLCLEIVKYRFHTELQR